MFPIYIFYTPNEAYAQRWKIHERIHDDALVNAVRQGEIA